MTKLEQVARAIARASGRWDGLPDIDYCIDKWWGLYAKEARAAIEAMREAWHPIETAPKDGTEIILGYFPGDGRRGCRVAFWHNIKHRWCDYHRLYSADGHFSPTHWRPLPEPWPESMIDAALAEE